MEPEFDPKRPRVDQRSPLEPSADAHIIDCIANLAPSQETVCSLAHMKFTINAVHLVQAAERPRRSTAGQLPLRLQGLRDAATSVSERHSRDRARDNRERAASIMNRGHSVSTQRAATIQQSFSSNFEHDAVSAQRMFAEGSGFDVQKQYSSSDRVCMKPLDVGSLQPRLQAFTTAMAPDQPISVCASCGMMSSPGEHGSYSQLSLSEAACLLVSEEWMTAYRSAPVELRRVFTVRQHNGNMYHLHQFDEETDTFTTCHRCCADILSDIKPQFNVGNGYDFGRNHFNFNLTVAEYIAVSSVVRFQTCVKFAAETILTVSGHVISFEHNGRTVLPGQCDRLPRRDVSSMLSVAFIGSNSTWHDIQGSREKRATFLRSVPQLLVDFDKVISFLRFKKIADPQRYGHIVIDDSDAARTVLDAVPQLVLDNATVGFDDDNLTADRQATGNVAEVDATQDVHDELDALPISSSYVCPPVVHQPVEEARFLRDVFEATGGQVEFVQPAGTSAFPIAIAVAPKPIDEFHNNDDYIIGLLPQAFLLGQGVRKGAGSLSQREIEHLFMQFDGRFAHSTPLIFTLFNQKQRHAACSNVAFRVRTEHKLLSRFRDITNADDFHSRLDTALKHPNAKDTHTLAAKLLACIRITGQSIPYSQMERESAMGRMMSLIHYAGPFSLFITIAPADMDQPLMIRFSRDIPATFDQSNSSEFTLPSLKQRMRILADNPFAAALVYKSLIENLFEHLIGLPLSHKSRKSHPSVSDRKEGLFGVPIAYAGVTEMQGRGSAHLHFIITTDLSPITIKESIDQPTLRKQIESRFDSIIQSWIPGEALDLAAIPSASLDIEEPTPQLRDRREKIDVSNIAFVKSSGHAVASACNRHRHGATCHKGLTGRWRCRFGLPSGTFAQSTSFLQLIGQEDQHGRFVPLALRELESTEPPSDPMRLWTDERTIVLQLYRPDMVGCVSADASSNNAYYVDLGCGDQSNVVTFSPLLSAVLGCNTCVDPLGSLTQSKSVTFYLLKYMTKDMGDLTQVLSLIRAADTTIRKYPSQAADSGTSIRTTQHLLTRVLNCLSGEQEYGGQVAALALLDFPSNIFSHDFHYCYIRPATAWLVNHCFVSSGIPHHHDEPNESLAECRSEDAVTDEDGCIIHLAPDNYDDDEHLVAGTLMVAVRASGEVTTVAQHDHYRHRSEVLAHLSFYEYCGVVSIIPKGDLVSNDDGRHRGRQGNLRIPFAEQHPQASTHEQRLRSKHVVPILAGQGPPMHPGDVQESVSWRRKADAFAAYVITLHHPWDTNTHTPSIPLTFDALQSWSIRLQQGHFGFTGFARLFWIRILTSALHSSAESLKLITAWRSRHATLWTNDERRQHQGSEAMREEDDADLANQALQAMQQLYESIQPDAEESEASKRAASTVQFLEDCYAAAQPVSDNAAEESMQLPNSDVALDRVSCPWFDEAYSGQVTKINKQVRSANEDADEEESNDAPRMTEADVNTTVSIIPANIGHASQILNEDSDSLLNVGQNRALILCVKWINEQTRFEADSARRTSPTPLRLLISGMAGTGKSFFVKALRERMHTRGLKIYCAAATGSAASGLPDGRTLHSAFAVSVETGNLETSADATTAAARTFGSAKILLIDEISLTSEKLLENVDKRLRQWFSKDLAFGGLGVILMGDLFQIPATGRNLITAALDPKSHVGRLFNEFMTIEFNEQMRAAADVAHARRLQLFRDPESSELKPVRKSDILSHICTLKAHELTSGSKFGDAVIVVTDNASRLAINKCKASHLAKSIGRPVIAFTYDLHQKTRSYFSTVASASQCTVHDLLSRHHESTFYFVPGAPAMITENISVQRRLANGTMCVLESLTLDSSNCDAASDMHRVEQAAAGELIFLSAPPLSINVSLDRTIFQDWQTQNSLSNEEIVVPLLRSSYPKNFVLSGIKRLHRGENSKAGKQAAVLRHYTFGIELAFSVTYHKVSHAISTSICNPISFVNLLFQVQGLTLPAIVLDLNGVRPPISVPAIYVGISRVRMSNDIRILPLHCGVKDKLLDLKFNEKLVAWWRGNVKPVHVAPRRHEQGEKTSSNASVRAAMPQINDNAKRHAKKQMEPATTVQQSYFRQLGLNIQLVPHHGNCLFEVFATKLYPNNNMGHLLVRQACVEYLRQYCSDFMHFILAAETESQYVNVAASNAAQAELIAAVNGTMSEEECKNRAVNAYLDVMSQPGQYGGQVEIEAVRQCFKFDVSLAASQSSISHTIAKLTDHHLHAAGCKYGTTRTRSVQSKTSQLSCRRRTNRHYDVSQ